MIALRPDVAATAVFGNLHDDLVRLDVLRLAVDLVLADLLNPARLEVEPGLLNAEITIRGGRGGLFSKLPSNPHFFFCASMLRNIRFFFQIWYKNR